MLNTSGYGERVDGGIGFSLEAPRWILEAELGDFRLDSNLPSELRSSGLQAFSILERLSVQPFRIKVRESIPLHTGLGAKTSFLLGLGYAGALLSGIDLPISTLANMLNRGGTSGIGVHSFAEGGFIWDAGRDSASKTKFVPSSKSSAGSPLLLTRIPVKWLSIVLFRFSEQGIYGAQEVDIFARHCPTPDEHTIRNLLAVNCYIVPGLLEKREALLQTGIRHMQDLGFKSIEWIYQDELTLRFRKFWENVGAEEALGISSFGPTLFVLTTRPEHVITLIKQFDVAPISLQCTTVSNTGKRLIEEI